MNPSVKSYLDKVNARLRVSVTPGYSVDKAPPKVLSALLAAERKDQRVRIFYGSPHTGVDHLTENDVVGTVKHVDGIPVLFRSCASQHSSALFAENIVRLLVAGREVYRHPGYKLPVIRISQADGMWAAYVNYAQEPHKLFPSERRAVAWKAFMHGDRLTK